jgi:hypothetical protein
MQVRLVEIQHLGLFYPLLAVGRAILAVRALLRAAVVAAVYQWA